MKLEYQYRIQSCSVIFEDAKIFIYEKQQK